MRKVLIVDDDPFIRKLIATTLEDVAGFELLQASDGAEAVDIAAREEPEIVFLDIDMPRLDGIEACARIRCAGRDGRGDDRDAHRDLAQRTTSAAPRTRAPTSSSRSRSARSTCCGSWTRSAAPPEGLPRPRIERRRPAAAT